ncbi:DMT family transporter [Pseudoroseicyclus tamaricis]|uniref:DMT family transporter n=1 Tax=Pseudoroseicyclus tamaricis TaxID=2705421 RepID=A0A6B2K1B5_9RHOB|nr:DMT family transporter [Pseudoroseicyclus tamaricis]NDV02749.1 DMT family transporter [Pseudoroseicyclus tamaricis]
MDIRAIGIGLAFAFLWSSAFASARIIVTAAPPLSALTLRYLIAGLLALAIAKALGQRMPKGRAAWRGIIVFGICQNGLYLGLNFVAMQWVEASLAAIIASSMPLIVALLGWIALGDRPAPLALGGLIVGMGGVALIMSTRVTGGAVGWGILLCVVGALALAVATLSVRSASNGGNLLMVVGLQMLVGAATVGLPALLLERGAEVAWSRELVLSFAYTTVFPGLVATWLWFLLVRRIGTVKASAFHFLNPFIGVAVAALLLGERLSWLDAVGVAIIAAGILAVQLAKAPPRVAAAEAATAAPAVPARGEG